MTAASADSAPAAALRARHTTHLVRNLFMGAVSYALDGLLLLGFFLTGMVEWKAPLVFTLTGISISAAAIALVVKGWNWRLRDPGIALPMLICNSTVQLVCLYLWPEVGFMFLLILFVVLGAGTLRIPVRHAVVAWGLMSVATGIVLSLIPVRITVPDQTLAQRALVWGFFVFTLGRCAFFGTFSASMRAQVTKRNSELSRLTGKVQQLAQYDELTGLMNRRSLLAILQEERLRASRTGQPLSVALLDLDFFKSINDTLGHLAGDKTLQVFAATTQRSLRSTDRFGRYGGEEFLLVFPATTAEAAQASIDRVRAAVAAADWSEVAPAFRVGFSAGMASYVPGETTEQLLSRADAALYRAKSEGRNCTRLDAFPPLPTPDTAKG